MLSNCGVGEDSLESLRLQGNQTSQSLRKSFLNIHWKDWCSLATWCEELTHQKRPWCWERLKAGEGADRWWDGWMASLTRWTWVWTSSGSWWRTGNPGMLQSIMSQRVRHAKRLNWMTLYVYWKILHGFISHISIVLKHVGTYTQCFEKCIFDNNNLFKFVSKEQLSWNTNAVI